MKLRKCNAKAGSRNRGVALVEFAMVLPLLLLLFAGLIDVGRGFSQAGVILNAAREGARYGIAHSTDMDRDDQIKNRAVEEASQSGLQIDKNNISIATLDGAVSGKPLTVRISYPYRPLLSEIVGVKTTIRKQCTMVIF